MGLAGLLLALGGGLLAGLVLLVLLLEVWARRSGFKRGAALPDAAAVGGKQLFSDMRERGWVELLRRVKVRTFRYEGMVATVDPAVIKTLLTTKTHCERRSTFYKLLGKFLPCCDGLLSMDGEVWHKHTKAVSSSLPLPWRYRRCCAHVLTLVPVLQLVHLFNGPNIAQYAGEMSHEADTALQRLQSGGSIGLAAARQGKAGAFTVDVACLGKELACRNLMRWAMGMDPDSELAVELRAALLSYLHTAWMEIDAKHPWKVLTLKRTADNIRRLVQRAIAERAYEHSGRDNFAKAMVAAGFPAHEVENEVNQLHVAHKAIGFTIAVSVFRAAQNPAWVRRMRDEFAAVLGDRPHPERSDLPRLPAAMAFFDEVLRCHVVSQGVARKTGSAPLEVADGVTLPPGTEVLVLLHALHHDPRLWGDDAEKFDPSRFEHKDERVPANAYLPFLEGTRHCRGMHLARLEWTVVMHAMLTRFDVSTTLERVPITDNMFTHIDGSLDITFTPRAAAGGAAAGATAEQ